jgi:two-component system KDP operon response regulator KdpE
MLETGATKAARILIVDDEPRIRRAIRGAFLPQGYDVLEACDGQHALTVFWNESPDLVLLDVNMPVLDGFEVCRQIRCASRVPIIMVTVRSSESDKVQALDFGADDYVVKPFGIEEILARIRSALRRSSKDANEAVIYSSGLIIDFERRVITVRGKLVHLTPKEFEVLRELAVNGGKPVSHRHLLNFAWGPGHDNDIESLRVIVNRLREKIELDPARPKYIQTEPFIGYRFTLPADARVEHSNAFSTVKS